MGGVIMGTALLQVMERKEKANMARRSGFVPGVIYGVGYEHGMPVKFEFKKLNKALRDQGKTPRFVVKIGEEDREVLVKEIQRDPISDQILHVDMQVLTGNERVKIKIPVIMTGRELLESKNLILEVYSSEVEISGLVDSLPDSVSIDVSELKPGDTITAGDIKFEAEDIRMHTPVDEILAVVSVPKVTGEQSDDVEEGDVE